MILCGGIIERVNNESGDRLPPDFVRSLVELPESGFGFVELGLLSYLIQLMPGTRVDPLELALLKNDSIEQVSDSLNTLWRLGYIELSCSLNYLDAIPLKIYWTINTTP